MLAVSSLQQVGWCLPHLNEPEDQGHDDDETAELTGPRTSLPDRIFVHLTNSQLLTHSDRSQKAPEPSGAV